MSTLLDLQPGALWGYFDQITRIPRPSKREALILKYLQDFAQAHELPCEQDSTGNLLITKPATAGMESRPGVIVQTHVDMVCEKNSDVTFDFEHDAIRTRIDGDWVKATGTTLGADCGVGMAAQLALLASNDVAHGPLEALFTVDEETGLTGAFGLSDQLLKGRYLLNLDSEDEGQLFIGCAGGIDTLATFTSHTEPLEANHLFFRLEISGLLGGHSGDDIDKGRGNSNKLLTRFLWRADRRFGLRLCTMDGGNLRNAIPREAHAIFALPHHTVKAFLSDFEAQCEAVQREYALAEPHLDIALSEAPAQATVLDLTTQHALLNALCAVPNGVQSMSAAMPGLVETSTNLASVKFTAPHQIVVTTSQRSSLESGRDATAASVRATFELAGATVHHSDGYPGWNPDPTSRLVSLACRSYADLFGSQPTVRAIHAGLECGLFLRKYPHLEMLSFGPTVLGAHSPDERVEISTVDKFWRLLTDLLTRI